MIHDPLPPADERSDAVCFTDRFAVAAIVALALLVAVHLIRWGGRGWLW